MSEIGFWAVNNKEANPLVSSLKKLIGTLRSNPPRHCPHPSKVLSRVLHRGQHTTGLHGSVSFDVSSDFHRASTRTVLRSI